MPRFIFCAVLGYNAQNAQKTKGVKTGSRTWLRLQVRTVQVVFPCFKKVTSDLGLPGPQMGPTDVRPYAPAVPKRPQCVVPFL